MIPEIGFRWPNCLSLSFQKMKTIFDETTRLELTTRIRSLSENSSAQWGKMTVSQMIKHCLLWDEMVQGKRKFKRVFLGRLFGRISLRDQIGNEKPLKHNIPTLAELKVEEKTGDVENGKRLWMASVEAYANFSNINFVHPFCGRMTREQVGHLAYKHIDHHLRQFNC